MILQWSPPSAEGINGIIQYYNISVTEKETGIVSYYISTSVTFVLTNLHPFYTYKCTIAAVTNGAGPITSLVVQMPEDGKHFYSVLHFINKIVPSSSPSNIASTLLTSNKAIFYWEPLNFENQNGLIRNYLINFIEIDTSSHFQYFSTTTNITITELHPYYTYSFSVAAVTISAGPFSDELIITTAQDGKIIINNNAFFLVCIAPSSAPVGISTIFMSSFSVALKWLPPPPTERNGIITGYNITIEDTMSSYIINFRSFRLNFTVNSLHPFTIYQYKIAAYTVVGLGPYSILSFFQTLEAG